MPGWIERCQEESSQPQIWGWCERLKVYPSDSDRHSPGGQGLAQSPRDHALDPTAHALLPSLSSWPGCVPSLMGLFPHPKPRHLHQSLCLSGEARVTVSSSQSGQPCFLQGDMCQTCLGVALPLKGNFQGCSVSFQKAPLCAQ